MGERIDVEELTREENERTPNRYVARAQTVVLAALLLACILNELGVFIVERFMIWSVFGFSCLLCAASWLLAYNSKTSANPKTKYVLMGLTLIMTLEVNIFLNISVVLLLLLPMLLATRYRSVGLSTVAVFGSALCCMLAPLLACLLNAWSFTILSGYLENACGVTILEFGESELPVSQVIENFLLYESLPQLIVILTFGFVTISITKNSKEGMDARLRVMDLSSNLRRELEHVEFLREQTILSVAEIIEHRDITTGSHVKRTSGVVKLLVNAMREDAQVEISDEFGEAVIKAAPLHDLGKIEIDDRIIRKKGRLDPEEREIIKEHADRGANMIQNFMRGVENDNFILIASNLARYHHEWYNGGGYPTGLEGDDIPLEARIMAIADVYDALVSKRSYKEAVSFEEAYCIIEESMGTQFDPRLNKYFQQVRPQIEQIYTNSRTL